METRKKSFQVISILLISTLCFSLLLVFLYHTDNKYTHKGQQPIRGILSLSEEDLADGNVLFLTREWQYYPDVLLSPKDFHDTIPDTFMQFITIGKYNDFSMGNRYRNPFGKASYRLILELPESSRIYTLALPEIYSSYYLYVNDELLCSMGDPEEAQVEIGKKSISFSAAGTTELLLSVSNQSHFYSGLTSPPMFGYPPSVSGVQDKILFLNMSVLLLIFLIGLFSLYLGVRLKMKHALFYSLLCLCLLFYISYPVTYHFFSVDNRVWYLLELVSTYIMYLMLVYLQNTVLKSSSRITSVIYRILAFFCVIALAYAAWPSAYPLIRMGFSCLASVIKIITALYLLWNVTRAAINGEANSYLILVMTGTFSISLLTDRIFPFYEAIYGGFFSEYGGVLLALGLGYALWVEIAESYLFTRTFAEEKRRLTMQVAMQKSHYQELTEQIAVSARQRHDLRHHLRAIYQFLLADDTKQAIEYLSDCDVANTGKHHIPLCENVIVDAMMQYYKCLCADNDILFDTLLVIPAELPINDADISILLGNLLENAYDACKAYDKSPAKISITGKYKDTGLLLRIENTFSTPVKKRGNQYFSSKHPGAGIGIESVRTIVRQYHGMITIDPADSVFQVSIMLMI